MPETRDSRGAPWGTSGEWGLEPGLGRGGEGGRPRDCGAPRGVRRLDRGGGLRPGCAARGVGAGKGVLGRIEQQTEERQCATGLRNVRAWEISDEKVVLAVPSDLFTLAGQVTELMDKKVKAARSGA